MSWLTRSRGHEQLVSPSEIQWLPLPTTDLWTRMPSGHGGRNQTSGSRRSQIRWPCGPSAVSSLVACHLQPPERQTEREREREREIESERERVTEISYKGQPLYKRHLFRSGANFTKDRTKQPRARIQSRFSFLQSRFSF